MGKLDKLIEFEERIAESDGFDIEKWMHLKPSNYDYIIRLHNKGPYSAAVHLYVKMGIHKYNLLKGTNLQFSSVEKYNEQRIAVCCAYYITLVAKDLDSGGSLVPFQTKVIEERYVISVTCDIARPKGQPLDSWTQESADDDEYPEDDKLPQRPSNDDAFRDKSRYYLVKKSRLEKYDWIRMYMELSFLKANVIKRPELSKLSFVKVAVESPKKVERPRDRLKVANATFYIEYKYRQPDMPLLHAITVIRRTVDKDDGAFTLMFDTNLL